MKYALLSLLFSFSFLFIECRNSKEDAPVPQQTTPRQATEFFVKVTADEIEYTFDGAKYIHAVLPSSPYFMVRADNSDFSKLLEFITTQGLTGKPESIPILGGNFARSNFDRYETIPGSVNGLFTVTKIDDKIVEGIFYFDVYRGTQKLTLKNGSFRLKITR